MEIEIRKWFFDAHQAAHSIREFLGISFRNILAHGHDHLDNEVVWGIIEDDLPELIRSLELHIG